MPVLVLTVHCSCTHDLLRAMFTWWLKYCAVGVNVEVCSMYIVNILKTCK
jgi:hypothetical protein